MVNFYYNLSGSVSVIKVGQVTFIIVGQSTLYFPPFSNVDRFPFSNILPTRIAFRMIFGKPSELPSVTSMILQM